MTKQSTFERLGGIAAPMEKSAAALLRAAGSGLRAAGAGLARATSRLPKNHGIPNQFVGAVEDALATNSRLIGRRGLGMINSVDDVTRRNPNLRYMGSAEARLPGAKQHGVGVVDYFQAGVDDVGTAGGRQMSPMVMRQRYRTGYDPSGKAIYDKANVDVIKQPMYVSTGTGSGASSAGRWVPFSEVHAPANAAADVKRLHAANPRLAARLPVAPVIPGTSGDASWLGKHVNMVDAQGNLIRENIAAPGLGRWSKEALPPHLEAAQEVLNRFYGLNKTAHTKSANVFLAVGDLLRTLRDVGGLGKVEQALTNPVAMGRRGAFGNIGKALAAPVLAPALGVMGVASKVDHAAKAHDPLRLLQMRSREAAVKGMSNRPVDRRQFVTDMMRGLLNPDVRQAAGTLGTAAVRGAASLAEKIASMEKSAAVEFDEKPRNFKVGDFRWLHRRPRVEGHELTAKADGQELGHIRYHAATDDSGHEWPGETWLRQLHVKDGHRERGVGSQLLAELLKRQAASKKLTRLQVRPFGKNPPSKEDLKSWYAERGFKADEKGGPDHMVANAPEDRERAALEPMSKQAAKWDKLWRAGKLGFDSLKRLGMQDAVVPRSGGGYKAVQTAYREAAATNMPRRFAREAPDYNWAPSGGHLGVREFNEPGLINMQTRRRADRIQSYTGIPTEVSRRTSGPKNLARGNDSVASYDEMLQDPLDYAPKSRAELYASGDRIPWSEAGGVSSYGIARTLGASTISNKLPWVRPKTRYSGHEGVIAHENGHMQQYADRHSGLMTDMINRRLRSTLPGGELLQPGTLHIDELAGHFNATKGMSFGNRAALKLPIYNAQNLSPGLPGQWASQIRSENPRMSDALLRKLVSVRSHLYSNYGVMPKSAASTLLEKLARYRRLDHARPNPSQAQIASQNFKMGHVDFHGLDLTIENEKGSIRRGATKEGKKWESVLTCPYGYIRSVAGGKSGERVRPKARDGDHIDVFVGPNKSSELVVAIDQYLDGKYDESKFLLGCDSQDEGVQLYRSNYQRGWPDMPASTCTFAQFKEWLKNGDHKKPFAGQMVKTASKARIFNRLRALMATTAKPVGVHSGSEIAGAAYHATRAPRGIAKDRFIRPSVGSVPGHSTYGEQAYFQTRAPIGIDATSAGVVVPGKKLLSNPNFSVNTPHHDSPIVPAMNVGVRGGHRLGAGDLMYSPTPLRELAGSGVKWAPSKMVEFMLNNRGASKRDFITAWGNNG